jgi:quercetin dioxygenase-like cupin family protein
MGAEDLQPSVKSFGTPEEVTEAPKARIERLDFGPYHVLKLEFEPGWKWSEHMKPTVGTDSCESLHFMYVLSGRHHARMDDGTDIEYGPGDLALIPPGHDGWTVGDEIAVMLDLGPLLAT